MRIYTEVIYNWDDKKGKLVEVSSKSFDYNGELALCENITGKSTWTDGPTWYDEAGNKWSARFYVNMFRRITEQKLFLNDEFHQRFKTGGGKRANANEIFKNYVTEYAKGYSDGDLFATEAELDEHWMDTYFKEKPGIETAKEQIARYTSGEWAYAGGDWREIAEMQKEGSGWTEVDGEWISSYDMTTEDIDKSEVIADLITAGEYDAEYDINNDGVINLLDIEAAKAGGGADAPLSTESLKALAQQAIEQSIRNWETFVDPDIADDVQLQARGYVETLKTAEEGVITAYDEIFGKEGALSVIEDAWETSVERGEEKYLTDIGTYETEKEEGLETTVTGREGELEALRGEAAENIRAAEAKVGAAGFASTDVGRTARDVLAEEIGGVARDIDEGFTEARSDVKQTYLEKIDPLKKEYGRLGTAYEDYMTTRDIAAESALDPWQAATTAYETAKTQYEELDIPKAELAHKAVLAVEAEDISARILDIRLGTSTTEPLDPDWNPFEDYFSGYSLEQFGIDPATMAFTGLPEAMPTDAFYTPYEAGSELALYDPDVLLPWEEDEGTSGVPYKPPGGQR